MTLKWVKAPIFFVVALLLSFTLCAKEKHTMPSSGPLKTIAYADLPRQGQQTLALIKQGGPFPFPKDGVVFGNYEGSLPKQPRGYYHEYTVPTPGAHNRGARRIIAGGTPASSGQYYYTDDHYATFKFIVE
jgi:ribonuclease T1